MRTKRPDSPNSDTQPLLPVADAAQPWGLRPRRLRAAIRAGELRAYCVDGWWRVRMADVEAWVRTHAYAPNSKRDGGAGA